MELRQLRYLDAVVRHQGFTRGAEELHVAQPAVSAQIKRLESELGVSLLERTTRQMRLTKAGELVLARARRALDEIDGIRADLTQLSGGLSGRIHIGSSAAVACFDLAAALAEFQAKYPDVEFALTSGWLRELLTDLEAHRIDFAIGATDALPAHIVGLPLYYDDMVLITAPSSRTRVSEEAPMASLADEPFACLPAYTGLRRILDRVCHDAGFVPCVQYETTDLTQLRDLVGHGFGVALVVRSVAESPGCPVTIHPLPEPVRQPMGLLCLRDRLLGAAALQCHDFLRLRGA